jgi:hypothetical protein
MRFTDKSRCFRLAVYYCERSIAATDPKLKAKFIKMAAWYRDRALEIDGAKRREVKADVPSGAFAVTPGTK